MNSLIVMVFSVVGALLYRLGGWEKGRKVFRRVGTPAAALAMFFCMQGFYGQYWTYFVSFMLLNYFAMSTYHDYVGYDNFYLTGLVYATAALPLVLLTESWVGFTLRCAILTIVTGLWSRTFGNDIVEETGRGFFYCVTMPLIF